MKKENTGAPLMNPIIIAVKRDPQLLLFIFSFFSFLTREQLFSLCFYVTFIEERGNNLR